MITYVDLEGTTIYLESDCIKAVTLGTQVGLTRTDCHVVAPPHVVSKVSYDEAMKVLTQKGWLSNEKGKESLTH